MEKFTQELLRLDHFILRILRYYIIGTVFFFLGLLPGVLGFYFIEGHTFMESSLNAISMLSGQPVEPAPATPTGRFFYCDLWFVSSVCFYFIDWISSDTLYSSTIT